MRRALGPFVVLTLMAAALLPAPTLAQTAPMPTDREITTVRGNLHRVRDGDRYTVFLVTPEGIILGDPLSTLTATWLKDEIERLFPGQPVRYVLYTHHHFDRAEGGAVFQGAERIAHRNFNGQLSDARRQLPRFVGALDRSDNGAFEAEELANSPSAPLILSKDRDGDGRVTADELYRAVQDIRRTYDEQLRIMLGGQAVELVHTGQAHSADMSVLFFPGERLVFAADPSPVAAVPFVFGQWRPADVLDWIHAVAPLDFDTLLFGDGSMLSRAELATLAAYLDAMRDEVVTARERGLSLARLQRLQPAPGAGPHDSQRNTQLTAMFRTLQVTRLVADGHASGTWVREDATYCASFATCSTGGGLPGGNAGLTMWIGNIGFGAELQTARQSWHARTSALYDEELALRETRVALLARYGVPRPGVSFAFSGGLSFTFGDSKGMSREKGAVAPLGGRHPLSARTSRPGITAGVDIMRPLSSRLAIAVPVRLTRFFGEQPVLWPGNGNVSVGAGLSMRLSRRVH